MKESDLAAPVADWLESQGYVVYSEVGLRDMVGMNALKLMKINTSQLILLRMTLGRYQYLLNYCV